MNSWKCSSIFYLVLLFVNLPFYLGVDLRGIYYGPDGPDGPDGIREMGPYPSKLTFSAFCFLIRIASNSFMN